MNKAAGVGQEEYIFTKTVDVWKLYFYDSIQL